MYNSQFSRSWADIQLSIQPELGCTTNLDSAGVGLMYNSRFSRSWADGQLSSLDSAGVGLQNNSWFSRSWADVQLSIQPELGCKTNFDSAGVGLVDNSWFSRSWASGWLLIQPELGWRTTINSTAALRISTLVSIKINSWVLWKLWNYNFHICHDHELQYDVKIINTYWLSSWWKTVSVIH